MRHFSNGLMVAHKSFYNCLDRHIDAGLGDKIAIHWEGEPGDRVISLTRNPSELSPCECPQSAWRKDRIAVYLPMIPELAIRTRLCAYWCALRFCWL